MAKRGRPIIHWCKYRYDKALGRWVHKKRYKHPVITVVKLDPEQALLAACKAGGGYFVHDVHGIFCKARATTGAACGTPAKGIRGAMTAAGEEESDVPS